MPFYRKTALTEAVQWDGSNEDEVADFLGVDFEGFSEEGTLCVRSPEGVVAGGVGYWVMRDSAGGHYLCDPERFADTHEPV